MNKTVMVRLIRCIVFAGAVCALDMSARVSLIVLHALASTKKRIAVQAKEQILQHPCEFNADELNPQIGDIAKVARAWHKLAPIAGVAYTMRILKKCGSHTSLPNQLSNARGAMYELETAADLIDQQTPPIALRKLIQVHCPFTHEYLRKIEIDIETDTTYIECKNCKWFAVPAKRMLSLKEQLLRARDAAARIGKSSQLFSKQSLPEDLRTWLDDHQIACFEG